MQYQSESNHDIRDEIENNDSNKFRDTMMKDVIISDSNSESPRNNFPLSFLSEEDKIRLAVQT
jgi:hypothetical protein